MLTSLDILLAAAALFIMLAGFARRRAIWRQGRGAASAGGGLVNLFNYLLSHRDILRRRPAGAAHLLVFWGFIVFGLVVILAQFSPVLPEALSQVISLLLDLVGLLLLAGTVYFLIRMAGGKPSPDGLAPKGRLLPGLIILGLILSGFLAEGARLSLLNSGPVWQAPVGYVISLMLPASPLLMQIMFRLHLLLALAFVALLPFGHMRHIVAASRNIFWRGGEPGNSMLLRDDVRERPFVRKIGDFTWQQLLESEACVSCGRCAEVCPATLSGKALSPRKLIQSLLNAAQRTARGEEVKLQTLASDDELWACTTCLACVEACPVLAGPADKVIELRRQRVLELGKLPQEARPMLRDLRLFGDTYGKGPALRAEWALNLAAPVLGRDQERAQVLIWAGCAGAHHPRYRQVCRSLVEILASAGVDFAILGPGEQCCGDPARRLGGEVLFQKLAKQNIARLKELSFGKIVTLCPHCLHTLKNEYPGLGGGFAVEHASQLLAGLIGQGMLKLKYPLADSLTIHDPCYLGRANRIYEPLRQISGAVPAMALTELERSREQGFCCGAGGGQMWLHESGGQRINQMRAQEVCGSGAQLVATACPYCLTMLEDGIGSLECGPQPKVLDIIEIVAKSMA